jgi:GxxExxY protein
MHEFKPLSEKIEALAGEIIDSAYKIHYELGPGLLESVYEACLRHELECRKIDYSTQVQFPIIYKGVNLDASLRIDLLVENEIIIEIKSVENMHPVFEAQLLTYLKLTEKSLGFLINFNVPGIKDGIKRIRI